MVRSTACRFSLRTYDAQVLVPGALVLLFTSRTALHRRRWPVWHQPRDGRVTRWFALRERHACKGLACQTTSTRELRNRVQPGFKRRNFGVTCVRSMPERPARRCIVGDCHSWRALVPIDRFPRIPASHLSGPEQPARRFRLMETVREQLRVRRYSVRTEQAYVYWIRRYVVHHDRRHPRDLDAEAVRVFLSHLATVHRVAASTHLRVCLRAREGCRPRSTRDSRARR